MHRRIVFIRDEECNAHYCTSMIIGRKVNKMIMSHEEYRNATKRPVEKYDRTKYDKPQPAIAEDQSIFA